MYEVNVMTDIQKIAALFKKVDGLNDDTDGRAVDVAVAMKLADMIKKDADVIAAVSGDAVKNAEGSFDMQLMIAPYEGNYFFMVYPDMDIAAAMDTGCTMCRLEELLSLVRKTPQMRGIQLILSVDPETHKFTTGQINRDMIALALDTAPKI
ncbi:MAG: hypothetical protein IKP25_10920 [Ruminococcus sp.]|nr:hypothetical protein [Ruminococcus sp.]